MARLRRALLGDGTVSAVSSLIAIAVGLVFGLVVLLVSNAKEALPGIWVVIKGGFNGGAKGVGQVLYYATPLIMTGLSVGFAFKTGLFNIGAPGQLMVGAFTAVYVGAKATFLPPSVLWLVALLCALIAGAVWGAIPGLFKSRLNVNEVIACIMCNYIAMYGINYLLRNSSLYDTRQNQTFSVAQAAIPKWGLDKIFFNMKGNYADVASVNGGIFLALFFAVLIYVVLNRTTFGYELKACGYNRDASKYAGINEKRGILLSMAIAGALAAVGGALMYLAPANGLKIRLEEVLSPQGFNGIPVALLGLSNPVGIIFAGLFVAHITQGGFYLQQLDFMPEVIDIIIAVIIYFSAFSLLVKNVIGAGVARLTARRVAASVEGEVGKG